MKSYGLSHVPEPFGDRLSVRQGDEKRDDYGKITSFREEAKRLDLVNHHLLYDVRWMDTAVIFLDPLRVDPDKNGCPASLF